MKLDLISTNTKQSNFSS